MLVDARKERRPEKARQLVGPIGGALAFVATAAAMVDGNGRYTPLAIVLVLVGFAGLITLARETLATAPVGPAQLPIADARPNPTERTWERVLAVSLLTCLALGLTTKPGEYVQGPFYRVVQALVGLALAGAVSTTFLRRTPDARACRVVFLAAVVAGFGLRLGMLVASPAPLMDVFVQLQDSARHLLAGLNPYMTAVSDAYHGTRDYGYRTVRYAYPPANLLPLAAGYALAGDIRFACIAAEGVVALGLYRVARPAPGRRVPMLLVMLFLFHPRGLFVIEQGWTEPFIAGAFALFAWLRERRPAGAWPVAYGYMLSLKQYLVYFVLHLFMIERRPRALALAAATAFLTVVPFLVWDPASFYTYGIRFQIVTTFRPDGLTVLALLYRLFGFTAGKWLAALVGLGVALYTYRRFITLGLLGYLLAVSLTTFSIFLFGSQAFCNYYYLVSVLCLFVLAVRTWPSPQREPRWTSSAGDLRVISEAGP